MDETRIGDIDPAEPQLLNIPEATEKAIRHHTSGNIDGAKALYQQILQAQPEHPVALHLLGLIAHQRGDHAHAVELIEQALILQPDYAEALNNLGSALHGLKRFDEAAASYAKAITLLPGFSKAHFNLGNLHKDRNDLDAALACYRKALEITPDYAKALNNLGNCLKEMNRLGEAAACYHKVLELMPDDANAHFNLAATCQQQGDVDAARHHFDRAISLKPEQISYQIRKALLLPIIPASSEDIETHRLALGRAIHTLRMQRPQIADPLADVGITNFHLAYHHQDNRPLMEAIAAFYRAACPSLSYEAAHCHAPTPQKSQRLRIGFLSSYFHAHTIGKLTRGLIEHLSRDRFEIVVFQVPGKSDDVTQAIENNAERIVPLRKNLDEDRPVIADQELDILFYPDIGMDPYSYFMAFARLAPLQVVSWGHPDTTGITNIDYFLSSALIEAPGSADQYSEKRVSLSLLPTCYERPARPGQTYGRADYGLPKTGALYVCPQTLFKFHPDFDATLSELLRRDPDGWLVLIDDGNGGHWDRLLSERLQRTDPAIADRIRFVDRMSTEKFLGLLGLADALLDIPTFSGGNSSLEAFAMAAPVVTWPGDFMRSRVTAGCYRQMGLEALIASDAESYISLALKLAHDEAFKQRMQRDIEANAHRLFGRSDVVREMEAFFIEAFEATQKLST